MIKAKVCGINNSENLKSLLTLPVDMVGFIFHDKSKGNCTLSSNEVKAAFNQQHVTAQKVGVFVDASIEDVLRTHEEYELDYIQLHGNESIFYCQNLKEFDVKLIKTFSVTDSFCYSNTSAYSFFCDYFLFDGKEKMPGGKEYHFSWSNLSQYKGKTPFLLSGGIGPNDVKEVRHLGLDKMSHVDVSDLFELEPGYKNLDLVADFLYKIKRPADFDRSINYKRVMNG